MDPRGTVGRIYKEDHYTLLHTKYDAGSTTVLGQGHPRVMIYIKFEALFPDASYHVSKS